MCLTYASLARMLCLLSIRSPAADLHARMLESLPSPINIQFYLWQSFPSSSKTNANIQKLREGNSELDNILKVEAALTVNSS